MQCYMSKKIALPKSINVKSIAWNKTHGYIACGAENGCLKVLKLESRKELNTASSVSSSSLSTNQSLEGHSGTVSIVQWNEPYQKLTSCDTNGFIMVWTEYKGMFHEEMVNNRQKSRVKGMAWNYDGQKICITYDDGVIIVGSVDGNRIWGKELKGLNLTCVEWSPDGRLLLLGCSSGEVHIYEFGGAFVGKVPMPFLAENQRKEDLIMISWFKKQRDPEIPSLAIIFESGLIQFMKNENDNSAFVIDTRLSISSFEWNFNGTILAVSGKKKEFTDEKSHEIKFYNPLGQVLYVLRFGGNICGLSWEKDGGRIVFAVDNYIFFATIRPHYKWCFFSNILAYAFSKSQDRKESTVMFWNTNTKEKNIKLVKNLISMASYGDFCCIATKSDENPKEYTLTVCNGIGSPIDSCNIHLEPTFICMNLISVFAASQSYFCRLLFQSPKNKILVPFTGEKPNFSDERCFYVEFPDSTLSKERNVKPICCLTCSDSMLIVGDSLGTFFLYALPEIIFYFIIRSDSPSVPSKISLNACSNTMASINIYGEITFNYVQDYFTLSRDPKTCTGDFSLNIVGSTPKLGHSQYIGSGSSLGFVPSHADPSPRDLHELSSEGTFESPDRRSSDFNISSSGIENSSPHSVSTIGREFGTPVRSSAAPVIYSTLHSLASTYPKSTTATATLSSTYLKSSTVTATNVLSIVAIPLEFGRKHAWDIKWASDDDQMCAIMDKMRMYIYRGKEPEEPMTCLGYMCEFKDLEVKAVLLSDLMQNPDEPQDCYFFKNDVKSLRDTRNLISNVGLKDATQFIEENPHPRLWRLLAEGALLKMDFATAESAFVRCKDYHGIKFVKDILEINDETIRRAEVQAYFKNYDQVDKIYLDSDMRMAAIALHRLLGDSFRVFELLKGDVLKLEEMEEAWNGIADYYFDRQQWAEAVSYYEKAHNEERLGECCYLLEDYAGLEKLLNELPENHMLLPELGSMFASIGMCEQAVMAYIKCNEISSAIDCCTNLNNWNMAITLAQKYDIKDVDALLSKYAVHLKNEKSIFTVIELYKKACKFLPAALMLYKFVKELPSKYRDPVLLRKLYVLIAILIEEYKKHRKVSNFERHDIADLGVTLEEEVTLQNIAPRLIDDPWRCARAYHFCMLAQKHLYQGYMDAAMKTALHLRDYEDILNIEDIYSLLALASCANRAFATCSSAFMRLESLEDISTEERIKYQSLAAEIFIKHPPKDSRIITVNCGGCAAILPDWSSQCNNCLIDFPICVASGRPIMNQNLQWTCLQCHHSAFKQEMLTRSSCALCHCIVSIPV